MCYGARSVRVDRKGASRSSTARVPAVPRGTAIVYTRYAEAKSVVLNPEDFDRLVALDKALTAVAGEGLEMSELVLEAASSRRYAGRPDRRREPDQGAAGTVSRPASGRLAGTVRWAVVPYTPRPPFRLYAGEGHAP